MSVLVHPQSQSVLIGADDPFMIRDLLPKSRLLPDVTYTVAVKHTLVSTTILRNIGFNVPSPIISQYRWPGKYKPFNHQREMADFYTVNKRCFNLSEMGCVDASTEYLSPTGWRRMDDYDGGQVAQYHPETGRADFVHPAEYVKLPCDTMIRVKTGRGVDQLLSPEHRVLAHAYNDPTKMEVLQAVELLRRHDLWQARIPAKRETGKISYGQITIPTSFIGDGGQGIDISDDDLRLQVAVIADGRFGSRTSRCVVRVKKPYKISRMQILLIASRREYEMRYQESTGFTIFTFDAPLRVKEFDARFWVASAHQLGVIGEELPQWDGSAASSSRGPRFYTDVKASADFAQYALSASGRRARLIATARERNGKQVTEYVVTCTGGSEHAQLQRVTGKTRCTGVSVEPSPDGYKYCFMVPSTFLIFRRNGCVFASGNTGKTAGTLWSADYLMDIGVVKKALVLSPLSTLDRVWRSDIFDVLMHRVAAVVHGTRDKRKAALATDADFYIMNHDGMKITEIVETIRKRPDINLMIVDEASMFRNHDTKKYKALERLLAQRPDMRLWMITGTPCPNAPTDAWALARLVSPDRVPKYFGAFKRATMMQITQFKWVPKIDAFTTAYEALQPAIRFKKADCLDLPPVMYEDRQCELTDEQRAMYEDMRKHMVSEAQQTPITAVNAADKISKLRQILCGAIKDPARDDYITIPHAPRLAVLKECIEQAAAKVIVIVPFKGIIHALAKELAADYSVAVLNGDVPPRRRDEIVRSFKETPDPHVLLCHPKVTSHGLNLTEADVTVFYAPIYSNDEFQQVVERFNRTGQTRKMTVIKIAGHPIEWEIYKQVDNRKLTQESILNLYDQVIK